MNCESDDLARPRGWNRPDLQVVGPAGVEAFVNRVHFEGEAIFFNTALSPRFFGTFERRLCVVDLFENL